MSGDSSDRKQRIFISYRRRVGADSAFLIHQRLTERLGDIVFYDMAAIKLGEPFPDRLRDALRECEVVLVLIARPQLPQGRCCSLRQERASRFEEGCHRTDVNFALPPKPVAAGHGRRPAYSAWTRSYVAPSLALTHSRPFSAH
jgi:hypothetical protein